MAIKTIIEPFRIKSVEPIYFNTRAEREVILEKADFNVFGIASRDVLIDLLTDSGTSAMSSRQWGGIMEGDESYAGSPSFYRFESMVKRITGMQYVIPTHQAELPKKYYLQPLEARVKPLSVIHFLIRPALILNFQVPQELIYSVPREKIP